LPVRCVERDGDGLASIRAGAPLVGTRATVFNCLGADGSNDPTICTAQLAAADGAGNFLVDPDATLRLPTDVFAEQSAYFHIDSHSRFLDALDPGFAARTPAGGIGRIAGYVNVFDAGAPLDNAFYSPGGGPFGTSGVMIYGQGQLVDVAYDAEVVYHELTHAAVDVTAGLEELIDGRGVNSDPGSLNEGTADTFAFAHVAEALATAPSPPADGIASASCLSRFFGAEVGLACLRQAANDKTCRGNGPNDGRNPGRDGEVHDDGEIWTGFTWALFSAAHEHGQRMPMATALFRALEAVGPHPTFEGYARTVRDRMAALGMPQAALDFADCTILQRDLQGCSDRAVVLFSGERAQGAFYGVSGQNGTTTAGQQYFIDVPEGAVSLHVQAGDATGHGQVYARYGAAVEFAGPGLASPRYDWLLPANRPEAILRQGGCEGCATGADPGAHQPFRSGRWYFLPSGSTSDLGGNTNVFELGVSLEMPPGQVAPARVPYTIGAPGTTQANVCTWGVTGATPANPIPAIPTTLPGQPGGGCGCGAGAPGLEALGALAVLVWLRRAGRKGLARTSA
jgi:hypothetical protein